MRDTIDLTRWLQVIGAGRYDRFDESALDLNTGLLRKLDNDFISPAGAVILKPAQNMSFYTAYMVSYLPPPAINSARWPMALSSSSRRNSQTRKSASSGTSRRGSSIQPPCTISTAKMCPARSKQSRVLYLVGQELNSRL